MRLDRTHKHELQHFESGKSFAFGSTHTRVCGANMHGPSSGAVAFGVLFVVLAPWTICTKNEESAIRINLWRDFVNSSDVPQTEQIANTTESDRFVTDCLTPNNEPAFCIPIKKCKSLMSVLQKKKAVKFLLASTCSDQKYDRSNPKVCCGTKTHFINESDEDSEETLSTTVGNYIRPPQADYQLVSSSLDYEEELEEYPLPKICGRQNPIMANRIYGGTEAQLGEFPWMARLVHKNVYNFETFGCSGFLISPRFVLTAAHCLVSDSLKIRGNVSTIQLGDHTSRNQMDCLLGPNKTKICAPPPIEVRVDRVVVHPQYKNRSHHNDIGLIYLRKAVRYTDFIQPICLMKDNNYISYEYTISGWGATEDEQSSKTKMKLEIPAFDKTSCKNIYQRHHVEILDSQICAGGQKGQDSCQGDSGGPLMMTPNGTVWFASGIVSFGISCGVEGYPGIYTSIPTMHDWIVQEMGKIIAEKKTIKS